jgi:hypothetical protein
VDPAGQARMTALRGLSYEALQDLLNNPESERDARMIRVVMAERQEMPPLARPSLSSAPPHRQLRSRRVLKPQDSLPLQCPLQNHRLQLANQNHLD